MNFAEHQFCFAELHTTNLEGARRFYGALFGWTLDKVSDGYYLFRLGGKEVVTVREAAVNRWVPSMKVVDADAVAAQAARHGFTIAAAAADTPRAARTCLLQDPEGAVMQLWQPGRIQATAVETGPGSLWWIELATADMVTAAARYGAAFGWTVTNTMRFENGPHGYTLFKVKDQSTAGAFQFEPDWGVKPAWQVYFEVTNFDAAKAMARRLGGSDGFWRDAPNAGRIGVLFDPSGALFEIAQPLAATPPAPPAGL